MLSHLLLGGAKSPPPQPPAFVPFGTLCTDAAMALSTPFPGTFDPHPSMIPYVSKRHDVKLPSRARTLCVATSGPIDSLSMPNGELVAMIGWAAPRQGHRYGGVVARVVDMAAGD